MSYTLYPSNQHIGEPKWNKFFFNKKINNFIKMKINLIYFEHYRLNYIWILFRLKWDKVESKPRGTDLKGTTFLTKRIGIMRRILIIHCPVIEIQQLSIVRVTRTSEVKRNKIYRWWWCATVKALIDI